MLIPSKNPGKEGVIFLVIGRRGTSAIAQVIIYNLYKKEDFMDHSSYIFKRIDEDLRINFQNGFYLKTHGRGGFIYYIEGKYVVPILIEMPGVPYLDILVFGETEHITHRYFPKIKKVETIDIKDRFKIQIKLVKWLEDQGIRHDIKIGK